MFEDEQHVMLFELFWIENNQSRLALIPARSQLQIELLQSLAKPLDTGSCGSMW